MPCRLKFKPQLFFSRSSAGARDIINHDPESYEVCDTLEEGFGRLYKIAASGSVTVDLTGIAKLQLVFVQSTKDLTVTLNGEPIDVSVLTGFGYGYLFLTLEDASSPTLVIQNDESSQAEVFVGVGGDEA